MKERATYPWKVSDAPDDYLSKLLAAIVGVEMPIARLSGKWKLGQNRPDADRTGMINGLLQESDESAEALAAFMREADLGAK